MITKGKSKYVKNKKKILVKIGYIPNTIHIA